MCHNNERPNSLEEIHKYFGPIQNKNGDNYVFSEGPKLIAKVEHLWMVAHQKHYFPTFRMIYLGMVRGMVMELKRK
jgi:hypothetical protein